MSERRSGRLPLPGKSSRSALPRIATAARAPSAEALAAGTTVSVGEDDAASLEKLIGALPDPASLPPGTLVVVPCQVASGARSLARSVLAVFGRAKTIPRARRCSALVARGYVDVGAAHDESRADVAWGYVPPAPKG